MMFKIALVPFRLNAYMYDETHNAKLRSKTPPTKDESSNALSQGYDMHAGLVTANQGVKIVASQIYIKS